MTAAARAAAPAVLRRIQEAVGPKGWTADADEMAPHLVDERGHYRGRAAMVVRPGITAEVAEVVRLCAEGGVPIVPQGGNTGLVGASVPFEHGGEIVLSLGRMSRIREIDPLNDTITAEAGCVLADIQRAAAEADRLFPLHLGAHGSCQIGGNLSTNAGGTAVLRYGNARQLTLGLEVVLPDGRVWDGLRALRKDNTGYDLKQLFIGAEGTLGVITAAVLRLFPRPRQVVTAFAAVADPEAAIALLARARAELGDVVTAFELISRAAVEMTVAHVPGVRDPLARAHQWYALIEVSSGRTSGGLGPALEAVLDAAMAAALVPDAAIAGSAAQAENLWRLREAISEAQKYEGASVKHDVSVPVSRVADFIAEATAACREAVPGIRPVVFGPVGDGNVHFNLSQPAGAEPEAFLAARERLARAVYDRAHAMGGSFSAEHGIGRLKREEMRRYKSETELDLMRRIKTALDPGGIMNPGKLL